MLLLGIDLGTSFVKVTIVEAMNGQVLASSSYPENEAKIISLDKGWAEQDPEIWWGNVQAAILMCHQQGSYDPLDISSIGIAYQMHGLVLVDKDQHCLRNSIIWCDSRAVGIGEKAFNDLGKEQVLGRLLNSPGNFTASKLAWVKDNEPAVYDQIDKVMLPGDFIAMKLTGTVYTSISALSEGIFWDFQSHQISEDVMRHFGFENSMIPPVVPVFSVQGQLRPEISSRLGLGPGVQVTYKAGDQPNNALSLNVSRPGEFAAAAGTSGVLYGITDKYIYDRELRVNTFAHVNHSSADPHLGVLLCINGTGRMNRWMKEMMGVEVGYPVINEMAASAPKGSEGLMVLPFGNGAERMLGNRIIGAQFHHIDLNLHTRAHLLRATQEGIAFSFRYGLDILGEIGMQPSVIRAGYANLFLSDVFSQSLADITGVCIELYVNDGSYSAAIGAGIGAGVYPSSQEAFAQRKPVKIAEPGHHCLDENYQKWKSLLFP